MATTSRHLRVTVIGSIAIAGLLALALLAGLRPAPAQAAELACPKFRVLHNDRIGKVKFPAGYYSVTVLNSRRLSCAQSMKLFAEFLQDWDGKLRKPWVLSQKGKDRIFAAGKGSSKGFRARPAGSASGSGSSPSGGGTRASCPGYFTVINAESIGSFKVPRGRYRLSPIDRSRLGCRKAFRLFRQFLLDFDGRLPRSWRLSRASATFYKPSNPRIGFDINRAYGPSPHPGHDVKFRRCPATFRVLHNDRIGRLYLPRGPYYIYVGMKRGLSCAAAANNFRRFLQRTDGRLPAPWTLNWKRARFQAGPNGRVFRVEKA